MKNILLIIPVFILSACASNPHKAEKIDTKMETSSKINGEEKVGIKDGNMIVQKKTLLAEELRDLQYDVYGLEDNVYGNTKYGSQGLYGQFKNCRLELSDKNNGGDGKLMWTEPIDRVTDKEEEKTLGLDEEKNLVAVSEEFIKDRIKRFKQYKRLLMKRQNEYNEKLDICKAELKSRKYDVSKKAKDE
ncbi:MAG: hypothetical protein IPM57_11490 [Oligoflexia bacterium]|nr:hypothetical protein [Oligoflexia bacterium]